MRWTNKKLIYILLISVLFMLGFFVVNANELININTAGLSELDSLPGIGPSKAQAIIDYREVNGNFVTIEDIMNVTGIGQGTFDGLKDLIIVSGGSSEGESGDEEDTDSTDYNGLNGGKEGVQEEQDQQSLGEDTSASGEDSGKSKYYGDIVINEIMFNPIGIDNDFNEWIEIYNNSNNNIYLTDWLLKDNMAEFKFDFKRLPAKGFVVIRRGESKLNLNNFNGEKIELFDSQNKLVDWIEYNDEMPEGQSYNWCGQNDSSQETWSQRSGEWQWLSEKSINNINNCPDLNLEPFAYFEIEHDNKEILLDASESYDEDGEIMNYLWEFENEVKNNNVNQKIFTTNEPQIKVELLEDKNINIVLKVIDNEGGIGEFILLVMIEEGDKALDEMEKGTDKTDYNGLNGTGNMLKTQKKIISTAGVVELKDIKDLAKETMVIVEGQVLVEPGILGATIFYIGDQEGGVQVYCYKKDFPGLVIGDVIQVSGEMSEYYNETRIKIKDKNDIYIIESGNMPEPREISLDEDLENYEGSLIKITGEITSMKYDYFFVDDGVGEIKVTVKKTTGMDIKGLGLEIGEQIQVIGILSETQTGYRLLPRYMNDIVVEKVLGENQEIKKTKKQENKKTFLNYLIAIVVAGIVVIGIIIIKQKRMNN